jgi:hypothetical protein
VQCFIKIVAPYINPGDRPTPEAKPDFNPNRGNNPDSTGGMPGLLTPIPPFVTPSFGLPTGIPGFNEGGGLALPPLDGTPTGAPDGLIPTFLPVINPPKNLPAFPDAERVKPKTPVQGGGKLRTRWKDRDGNIYEWDYQHGQVEVYNKRGNTHLGQFDPDTGEQTKPGDPNRSVQK